MDKFLEDKLLDDFYENLELEPADWDNEFYVNISRASALSGMSESQIRYLENFPRIPLGQKEGSGRNRVYTKRDVRLLKWIYSQKETRPAAIAQFLEEKQQAIFEKLGHITLQQTLQREQNLIGRDMLISHLVMLLVSILQDALVAQNMTMEGIILGPATPEWKTLALESIKEKGNLDLADSLVVWSSREQDIPLDLKIFFSSQPWYYSFSEKPLYSFESFSEGEQAFTVLIFWRCLISKPEQTPHIALEKSRSSLATMVMQSLKRILDILGRDSTASGEPVSVYSRSAMGGQAMVHGLTLLIESCIKPYFPNCDIYIGKFEEESERFEEKDKPASRLKILNFNKGTDDGYLNSRLQFSSDTLDTLGSHELPWWIEFAQEKASVALDQDITRRTEGRVGSGSVVCIPLVGQAGVVGVLGVENTHTDGDKHCLAERDGIGSQELLCYLICIAEIAADYLNLQLSFAERAERSRLAYTRNETITWYLNVYHQGGLNYTETVQKIVAWAKQFFNEDRDSLELDMAIIDIMKEGELAKEYKGFDIIIKILEETQTKMEIVIKDDVVAEQLRSQERLFISEPITDHLVLAAPHLPPEYFRILLERIKNIWQPESRNTFMWGNKKVPVALQVGVCTLTDLRSYNEQEMIEVLRHHLWMLSQHMVQQEPLKKILEYDAVVPIIKITE